MEVSTEVETEDGLIVVVSSTELASCCNVSPRAQESKHSSEQCPALWPKQKPFIVCACGVCVAGDRVALAPLKIEIRFDT